MDESAPVVIFLTIKNKHPRGYHTSQLLRLWKICTLVYQLNRSIFYVYTVFFMQYIKLWKIFFLFIFFLYFYYKYNFADP